MSESFLFYDLETWGANPRTSRIAQFAAIRTNAELEVIAPETDFLIRPANDLLPSPEATLITGLLPQTALAQGLTEAEAMARIAEEMGQPHTCCLGYNSLRFDDEFIRFGLYRNFHDPYEREWRNGNSRWDLLDVVRLAHALRPEGIIWRQREDGRGTSFKLEHLAEDNGLREGLAHEALSDVRALIGLARQLKRAQPKLWDYALGLRNKRQVMALLDPVQMPLLLHVSQRYSASRLCAAPVIVLCPHPEFDGRAIVLDLAEEIEPVLSLSAAEIAARVFVAEADLPAGTRRIGLKEIHANRCPALVQWAHLRAHDFDRLGIDAATVEARAASLRQHRAAITEKMRQVFARQAPAKSPDADAALYDGFIPEADKRLMTQVRACRPEQLGDAGFHFRDARLNTLLLRYRARNWPDTLSFAEKEAWQAYRQQRLHSPEGGGETTLPQWRADIARLQQQHAGNDAAQTLLHGLALWADTLEAELA